jgi:transposase InsO family protein
VAVDDHARFGFTQMKPNERQSCAAAFLRASVKYFAQLGVTVRRVLTDNGPAFRSKGFAATCRKLGSDATFHARLSTANQRQGRALHSIGVARMGYGIPYQHSAERRDMLNRWIHHYNWHRPHQGIGGLATISRWPSAETTC